MDRRSFLTAVSAFVVTPVPTPDSVLQLAPNVSAPIMALASASKSARPRIEWTETDYVSRWVRIDELSSKLIKGDVILIPHRNAIKTPMMAQVLAVDPATHMVTLTRDLRECGLSPTNCHVAIIGNAPICKIT